MEGEKRRENILSILRASNEAISGTSLAKKMKVSRQVIVQDIALLRATDKNILSTNKGYVLYSDILKKAYVRKVFKVKHDDASILDELYTIVDPGGSLLNVIVEHPIYGEIFVDLVIQNRSDAIHFVEDIKKYNTKPLTYLTDGIHLHTVEAKNATILEEIEDNLRKKGYLIEN